MTWSWQPRCWSRALLILVTALLAACRSIPARSDGARDFGLRKAAEAYARSFATKNADSIVAFFDSAIVVVSPQGRAPVEGIAANRAGWERLFRGGNPSHNIAIARVEVAASGELGYITGRWAVGVDTPGGRSEAHGHYLSVWRRRGDVWRQIAISAYVLP